MGTTGLNAGRPSRGRVVLLLGLSVILAAMVVRHLAGNATAPASASGATAADATTGASLDPSLATGGAARAAAAVPERWMSWPMARERDPFASALVYPPPAPEPEPEPVAQQAPAPRLEDVLLDEARSKIVLQATMLGEQPLAVINGTAYRVGHVVHGFTLRRIGANLVVLEKQGVSISVRAAVEHRLEGAAR